MALGAMQYPNTLQGWQTAVLASLWTYAPCCVLAALLHVLVAAYAAAALPALDDKMIPTANSKSTDSMHVRAGCLRFANLC